MRLMTFAILSYFFLSFNTNDEWKLEKDNNEILVYTKRSENSNFKTYKAQGVINTSIDKLYAFLIRFDNYKNWVPNCIDSKLLYAKENKTYLYYAEYDMPWPFQNRDAISEISISKKADGSVYVSSRPGKFNLDKKKGILRINEFAENYMLIPTSDNKVVFHMQGSYNPGGNLPAWLANIFISDGPYDTIIKLRKLLENQENL